MKIAIAAGGTGGHIYPALTLAEALKAKGHEIVFFGSYDRMEKEVIPPTGFKFIPLKIANSSGNIFHKCLSILTMFKAYFECKNLLKDFSMVIGFGNYISLPVVLAGKALGLKTIIHEQNSFVGKANKYLDEKVDLVLGSYLENKKQFKNKNTFILGNPQASKALKVKKDEKLLEEFGLDKQKKTVLIFMGSLGSESVNQVLIDFFKLLDGKYQVIYATGRNYYEYDKDKIQETSYLKVRERVEGIKLMKVCNLLVSRAGATTLSEITSLGMPSILIPSPYVPNNHQYFNGKSLVDKTAALMIEEKDLSAKSLKALIDSIIDDDQKLMALGQNARKLANDTVLEDIIKKIEEL